MWTKGKDKDGYGKIKREGKDWRAHRYVYFLSHGTIDNDLMVCHTCDNTSCVKPEHLFQGTAQDNSSDMKNKGRGRGPNNDKKFCKRGHEFTPENTDQIKSGRRCRACRRIRKN